MRPVFSHPQLKTRPTHQHFVPVVNIVLKHLLQRHLLWPAVHQRNHIGPKGTFQLRVFVELV